MLISKFYINIKPPLSKKVLWIKPLEEGFALYIWFKDKWLLLKIVDDKGTPIIWDDINLDFYSKEEIDNKLADILGLDADGIAELKAIIEDGDSLTGLLKELKNKVNKETGKGLSTNDYTTQEKIITENVKILNQYSIGLSTVKTDVENCICRQDLWDIVSSSLINHKEALYFRAYSPTQATCYVDDDTKHMFINVTAANGLIDGYAPATGYLNIWTDESASKLDNWVLELTFTYWSGKNSQDELKTVSYVFGDYRRHIGSTDTNYYVRVPIKRGFLVLNLQLRTSH